MIWRCDFNAQADLDNFRFQNIGTGGSVAIENGVCVFRTNTIDQGRILSILPDSLGFTDITRVSFSYRFTDSHGGTNFPHIRLHYVNGYNVTAYIYNEFPWSGYSENNLKALYNNNGSAIAWTSDNKTTKLFSNSKSNCKGNNFVRFDIVRDPSTDKYTVTTSNGGSATFQATYQNSKITTITSYLNYHWFDNSKVAYIDWIELEGPGQDFIALNINGEWKQVTPYININGVWKPATSYINIDGEWK